MKDYRTTLKKVGTVLAVVGLLDITLMVYCISNGIPYCSSLNVFALIGGLFLLAGSLKAARIVAFLSAFLLGGFGCMFVMIPTFSPVPLDLIITSIKLNPLAFTAFGIFIPLSLALLFWTYRQLTSLQIVNALTEQGINTRSIWRRPRNGLIIGACIPILALVLMTVSMNEETRELIVSEARREAGEGYKYFINGYNIYISSEGKRIRAKVFAYSDTEIKEVIVTLEE